MIAAVPVASVTALAVLIGIWFIVAGLFEIVASFMLRSAVSKSQSTTTPPRRADEGAAAL